MKKRILDTIGMIIISIVIAVFNLIVGANEKGLRTLPMCIILFVALTYLIVRKIMLKQNIVVKNKIDLFVLLFICSTMLPLIFKTYCTLQGTIEFILKYFFVYAMYLVVRNTIDTTKKVEVLASVTIISSLIVIILGIDLQHGQYLKTIINKLNLRYVKDPTFSSTFGYSNAVAIYIAFCMFLSVHKVKNSKSKIVKILNIIYMLLGFYIVYITMSRAVLLLLLAGLLLYFIIYYYKNIVKNKKILITFSCALIAIIAISIYILTAGLKYSKPLEITDGYGDVLRYPFEANKEYEIKLDINTINVENNDENVDQDSSQNNKYAEQNNSEIKIIEENKYINKKILASEQLENFNGTKTFKITPDSNLLRIKIEISNKSNEKIIINKCYINNEESILNYKYIPNVIATLFKSFSLKDGSLYQRLVFYKDCLKIAKDNWLIGQGGNAWKKLSFVVQEYLYNIKETHSYFFELLISYGIVGVILFLAVFIGFNIKLIQEYKSNNPNYKSNKDNFNYDKNNNNNKKYKLAILLGLDVLILHTFCFDFNMSFLIINLLVFMYIAALMYDSNDTEKKEIELKGRIIEILDYIVLVFLSIILVTLICASIAKYCVEDKTIKKNLSPYNSTYRYDYINTNLKKTKDFNKKIAEIQELMKYEPYYKQNILYNEYWNLLLNRTMNIKSEKFTEYLKFINNQYKTVKIAIPMQINFVIERATTMENAYTKLKEMNYSAPEILKQIEVLKQIIKEEYETNIVNIKDADRNGLGQENIDKIILKYDEILKKLD